jgi:hypothetical protein
MMINIQFAGDFSSVESVYATMMALKIPAVSRAEPSLVGYEH